VRLPVLTTLPAHTTRPRKASVAALAALSLCLVTVGVAASSPASADITQEIKDSQAQLDRLNAASEAAAERYNAGRIELAAAQRTATTAQAAMAREEVALTRVRSQMSAYAAGLYRSGPGGAGLGLITTGDPNTYLQRAGTLNEISKAQSQVMADFATAKSRQATATADATSAVHDAQKALQGLEKDKAQVEAASSKAQQILQDLQVKQAQLIQAAKDQAARKAAVARAAALAAEARNAAAAAALFRASPVVEPPQTAPVQHYSGNAAQIAVKVAMDQLGKSYVYGAAGPDHFDCSGLTMYAYAAAGISLPHHAASQFNEGHHVAQSELQPGDLVFFEKNLGHMGMYIGNGNFIHSPHTGDVVKISALSGYYQNEYAGAVRL
jgi:cell wall-associated NlpC family hydrolase